MDEHSTYKELSDSLGKINRITLPNGALFEHRGVACIRGQDGQYTTQEELPQGHAFTRVSREGDNYVARVFLPGEVNGQKAVKVLCGNLETLFGVKIETPDFKSGAGVAHVSLPNDFGYFRARTHADGQGDLRLLEEIAKQTVPEYTPSGKRGKGLLAGATAGLVVKLLIDNVFGTEGMTEQWTYAAVPFFAALGLRRGQRLNRELQRQQEEREQKPYKVLQALRSGADNGELKELAGVVDIAYRKLLEIKKEDAELKIDLSESKEMITAVMKRKNQLASKKAELEKELNNYDLALQSLARSTRGQKGVVVELKAQSYAAVHRLLAMTLGYDKPVNVKDKDRFEMLAAETAKEESVLAVDNIYTGQPLEVKVARQAATDSVQRKGNYFGEYKLLEVIGAGGMGTWYKATGRGGKVVAIKFPTEKVVEAFKKKAGIYQEAAALKHPSLMKIIEVRTGDEPYLVAEYIDGVNLRELMKTRRLPVEVSTEIAFEIAKGLAHAHDRGMLHNDIKPENVLIDRNGRVIIADFDIAEATSDMLLSRDLRTTNTSIAGTFDYAPPERRGEIDAKTGKHSDIFSWGKVFYEMLTGQRTLDPRGLRTVNTSIPTEIEDIINGTLIVSPELRTSDAKLLANALQKLPRRKVKLAL